MKKIDIEIGKRYAVGHPDGIKMGRDSAGKCVQVTGFTRKHEHPPRVFGLLICEATGKPYEPDEYYSGVRPYPYREVAVPWDQYVAARNEANERLADKIRDREDRVERAHALWVRLVALGFTARRDDDMGPARILDAVRRRGNARRLR